MRYLDELLGKNESLAWRGELHRSIGGIAYDSRRVKEGDCYVAIKGFRDDGFAFVSEAVGRGAAAVVSLHPPPKEYPQVTWVQVKNDRRALSAMASRFHGDPSRRLQVVGVTGTNGKTTTVALIQALFGGGTRTAAIGTLGMDFAGQHRATALTTPEAPELFAFMAGVLEGGGENLVMEVSSAALSLHRVDDIAFTQAVFTSFSGDHIDFHGSMENYFEAKLSLFKKLGSEHWAIVNGDDPWGARLIRELDCRYVTFGFSPQADIRPLKHQFSLEGLRAVLQTPRGKVDVQSRLLGRFNLMNIMAAVSASLVKGIAADRISAALQGFQPVKGRASVAYAGDFQVVVDYAHTDDALQNLLKSFREIGRGRLILVFGAGGSRDKTKRPRMARVACRHADYVFVTSDNPRQEDPQAIMAEIVAGFDPGFSAYRTEPDRREAIIGALDMAAAGDVVLIAGKGHENYQIFKDRTVPFDDFEVVREKMGGGDA
ncbi:MAG: UDP-N-acetylmuramoyl-L-alanyl-D-glutamate--2,6-diaminopimelate ligase [Candidatus Aminicenantes bacterium]|nr:UDP-N-acetylmuramoyl-L-alanyl-D-glutamate--2,6-diaminopimelate ligase [Candidatus Aminicenantes bacterium]